MRYWYDIPYSTVNHLLKEKDRESISLNVRFNKIRQSIKEKETQRSLQEIVNLYKENNLDSLYEIKDKLYLRYDTVFNKYLTSQEVLAYILYAISNYEELDKSNWDVRCTNVFK